MLTARELPPEEWWRLKGTALDDVRDTLPREGAVVIVAEDGGIIVGTLLLMKTIHAEALRIAAPYRRKGWAARKLLRQMAETVRGMGAAGVIGGAGTPEMESLLCRMGGAKLPWSFYAVPLDGRFSRVVKEG